MIFLIQGSALSTNSVGGCEGFGTDAQRFLMPACWNLIRMYVSNVLAQTSSLRR